MFCNKCGKELMPDAKFCTGCGAPVVVPAVEDTYREPIVVEDSSHVADSTEEIVADAEPRSVISEPPVFVPQPTKKSKLKLFLNIGIIVAIVAVLVLGSFGCINLIEKAETEYIENVFLYYLQGLLLYIVSFVILVVALILVNVFVKQKSDSIYSESDTTALDTTYTESSGSLPVYNGTEPAPVAVPVEPVQPVMAEAPVVAPVEPVQPVVAEAPVAVPVEPVQPVVAEAPVAVPVEPVQPVVTEVPVVAPVEPVQPVVTEAPVAVPVEPVQPVMAEVPVAVPVEPVQPVMAEVPVAAPVEPVQPVMAEAPVVTPVEPVQPVVEEAPVVTPVEPVQPVVAEIPAVEPVEEIKTAVIDNIVYAPVEDHQPESVEESVEDASLFATRIAKPIGKELDYPKNTDIVAEPVVKEEVICYPTEQPVVSEKPKYDIDVYNTVDDFEALNAPAKPVVETPEVSYPTAYSGREERKDSSNPWFSAAGDL